MRAAWVYILASQKGTLYVGVTSDIRRRIAQHKSLLYPGFTQRYQVTRLVYLEQWPGIVDAIAREKQIKGWRREKKVRLVEETNPYWRDLAEDGI